MSQSWRTRDIRPFISPPVKGNTAQKRAENYQKKSDDGFEAVNYDAPSNPSPQGFVSQPLPEVFEEPNHAGLMQIETMKRLGAPLLSSIVAVNAHKISQGDVPLSPYREAETLSQLVSTTMSLVRHVSSLLSINDPKRALSAKFEAIAFITPLVASEYCAHGVAPDAKATLRLVERIDSVLSMVDNTQMGAGFGIKSAINHYDVTGVQSAPVSTPLMSAHYLEASIPVIEVVSRFAFDLKEGDLLKTIMARLMSEAESLVQGFIPEDDTMITTNHRGEVELSLLTSMAKLYAQSHVEEIERLSVMDQAGRDDYAMRHNNAYSLAPIWQSFERRTAMMRVLADHLQA